VTDSTVAYAVPVGSQQPQDGRKRQRRLRAPVRRELILDAALRVFAERGYKASMGEVAEAAGITRTVLYYYAPSKKDLFLEVAEAQVTEFLRYLAPAIGGDAGQFERLRQGLDAALRFGEEQPHAWRLLFLHLDEDEPDMREIRDRVHETTVEAVSGLLESDAASIGVDPDSTRGRIMAEMVFGAGAAVGAWRMTHPSAPREEVLDAMSDFFWHGLNGLGDALRARKPKRRATRAAARRQ